MCAAFGRQFEPLTPRLCQEDVRAEESNLLVLIRSQESKGGLPCCMRGRELIQPLRSTLLLLRVGT